MPDNEAGDPSDASGVQPSKNIGRRRLLQMLTAGGGLAAAGMVPSAWVKPVADILDSAPAAAGPPSPSPSTSVSPTPSVSVSLTTSPPPPTPSVQASGAVRATPPFTG